jgi:uncharacterized protein (TIGR02996 family)
MTDEAHFIEALRATPGDQALRLIYADWLEERGDSRADYLRLEHEVLQHLNDDVELKQLEQRLTEILPKLDAAWIELTARKCDVYLIECSAILRIEFIKLFRDEKIGSLLEARDCVESPWPRLMTSASLPRAIHLKRKFEALEWWEWGLPTPGDPHGFNKRRRGEGKGAIIEIRPSGV